MADVNEIEKLALELMRLHGLDNWVFRWSNAKQTFGYCAESKKTISLSKPLVMLNSVQECRDTILHEIAHALAGCRNGHNYTWQKTCVKIGAKPERCYKTSLVKQPTAKYKGICACINKNKWKAHRKPKNGYSCNSCGSIIKWFINLEWCNEQLDDLD